MNWWSGISNLPPGGGDVPEGQPKPSRGIHSPAFHFDFVAWFFYIHHYINAILLLYNAPDYTRLPDGQESGTADELGYAMIRIINPAG